VGQSVQPGQLIAKVSAWDGGATHTHIELWKSYPPSNGYRLDNMEDPLPYLRALYGQPGAAAIPPGGIDPAAGGIPAPAAGAPAAGVPAGAPVAGAPVAGAPVAGAPAAGVPAGAGGVDIAHVPNVSIPPDAAQALASPDADPRAAAQIAQLAAKHEIGIASVQVEGDRTTVIIASVDGQPVGQGNVAARDLAQELAATPAQGREVATPWPIRGLRTGDDVADRIELSFGSAPAPAPALSKYAISGCRHGTRLQGQGVSRRGGCLERRLRWPAGLL